MESINLFEKAAKLSISLMIQIYKVHFSFMFGGACRFHPSCSVYAEECFHKHSFFTGLRLSVYRILRCHPFQTAQIDPVPSFNQTLAKK